MPTLNSLIEVHIQEVPREVLQNLMPHLVAYCHLVKSLETTTEQVNTIDPKTGEVTLSLALFIPRNARMLVIPTGPEEGHLVILADNPQELKSFKNILQECLAFLNYPEDYNQILDGVRITLDSFTERENVEKRLLTANLN